MYIYGVIKKADDDLKDVEMLFQGIDTEMGDTEKRQEEGSYKDSVYAVAYEKNQAVAAGMLVFYSDNEAEIKKLGVVQEKRRQKYGDMVLRMLLANAFKRKIDRVNVACNSLPAPFLKQAGFHETAFGYTIQNQDFISPCSRK